MNEFIIISENVKAYFSSHASLAALGRKVKKFKLFDPITRKVKIAQKTVKYRPTEKLMDGFITLLAGAQEMVEVNKRLKADPGLQRAFGRMGSGTIGGSGYAGCLHRPKYRPNASGDGSHLSTTQSDVSPRLSVELAAAGHGYDRSTVRQEGYVVGTWYEEIVVERLFDSKTQLNKALRPLIEAAEQVLELDERKRQRTILRIDSGGGSVAEINWLLRRGYQVHGKDYSGVRAKTLAESVTAWVSDPSDPNRQFGWVTVAADLYCRPVK